MNEMLVETWMVEMETQQVPPQDILARAVEEFGEAARRVYDRVFTMQDRIAQRLGIKM